jgi:hypothetical protein
MPQDIIRARLNLETAQIRWSEMQRYFAAGTAIQVAPELDLLEAACQLSADNSALIGQWMALGQFGKVSDDQALLWYKTDALLWAVVVSPWVLLQPVTT